VAFFHKRSRTLLVTDSVLSVPEDPPAIVNRIIVSRKTMRSRSSRTTRQAAARDGSASLLPLLATECAGNELGQAFRDALKAPDRSKQAYFGLFPFRWKITGSSHLMPGVWTFVCGTILQTFILNQAPRKTLDWADKVANWDFQRIVTCHFPHPGRSASVSAGVRFLESSPHSCELVRKWMRPYPGRF